MRRGNFMTAPEGGWLHDEQALTVGEGVYYSFPVKVRLGTCTAHAQHAFESELAFFFFFLTIVLRFAIQCSTLEAFKFSSL